MDPTLKPTLDSSLRIPFELWFEDFAPGYPTIRISNQHASATIALHGAHVMDYIPRDQAPVIFTSREAIFKEGKAIRGGIPVCWPWFSAHPSDASMPAHGFARNRFWQLTDSKSSSEGTEVTLELATDSIDTLPKGITLTLTIFVGESLTLELTTQNGSTENFTVGGALHSYFYVGDIQKISLQGLDSTNYIDTITKQDCQQAGELRITGEVDNVYTGSNADIALHDPVLGRNIHVAKVGSQSTVIWNPWVEKASALGDLADDEFQEFICIEAANAFEDVHTLSPGESHTLGTTITSTPFD